MLEHYSSALVPMSLHSHLSLEDIPGCAPHFKPGYWAQCLAALNELSTTLGIEPGSCERF